MNWPSRLIVLLALAGMIAAPLATLHPIATHLREAGEGGLPHELTDAAVISLLILGGASLLPMLNVVRIVLMWSRQANVLRILREDAETRTTQDGVAYCLIATSGVHFFTAGLLRPRIFASSGALTELEPRAFRAAILHEREHQRSHHVAWRAALAVLETAFRPVTPIRRTISALALECEFAADRAALAAGAGREHLFEAVVAAARSSAPSTSVPLAGAGTLERLDALATMAHRRSASGAPLVWLLAALSGLPLFAHALFWFDAVCL